MKKFTLILAALCTMAAAHAKVVSVTWDPASITDASGTTFNGTEFAVDENLKFTVAMGESTKDIPKYFNNSTNPCQLRLYSKNTLVASTTAEAILSIKFNVYTETGQSPDWTIKEGSNTYNAAADTWTGSQKEVSFIGSKVAWIKSIEFTYEDGKSEGGDTPVDYKEANLFFSADQVATLSGAQTISLENEGVSVVFTTASTASKVEIKEINGYFGTADDYETIPVRFQPGGKSSKGTASEAKGLITLPCDGALTMYVMNPSATELRNVQIVQGGETLLDKFLNATPDATVTVPAPTEEDPNATSERKIYTPYTVDLAKGTAYFLWPTNQISIYGFRFAPKKTDTTGAESVTVAPVDNTVYDLMGRRVSEDYRGIVIIGGKKYLRR